MVTAAAGAGSLLAVSMVTTSARGGWLVSVGMGTSRWWSVAVGVLLLMGCGAQQQDNNDLEGHGQGQPKTDEDFLLKQVIWKRCYRRLTPGCLKLNLVRTVELMSKDSSVSILPGVFFTSNSTESLPLPPEVARSLTSEHAPLDDLAAFALGKYLRSLTLNVHLVDFVSGGNKTLQNSVIDVFSGRAKKDGLGGYGAIAAMMGGMMASMMMAALAALAGKALMTSLLALMMAAFAAMKGGGDGGHESKTYEVITKPVVSHINTHSSEVQHHDHGHYHRSLDLGGEEERGVGPYYRPSQGRRTRGAEEKENQELGPEEIKVHDMQKRSIEYEAMEEGGDNSREEHVFLKRGLNLANSRNTRHDERENSDFYHTKDQKNHISKRSVPSKDSHPQSVKFKTRHQLSKIVNRDINRHQPPQGHTVQKRSTTSPTAVDSKIFRIHGIPENGNNILLGGHPRQNHREYKRYTEDDLIMALGLLR